MLDRISPFDKCPIFETKQLLYRLVKEEDAEDLLKCYSDPKSAKIFNSDNCNSNFVYESIEEVRNIIKFWIREYNSRGYVRFSIIDKQINSAVGTIEIFAKKEEFKDVGKVGVLRLDLSSEHETRSIISEIMDMINNNFQETFEINSIITKATPIAKERILALKENNYKELEDKSITSYDSYFIKVW